MKNLKELKKGIRIMTKFQAFELFTLVAVALILLITVFVMAENAAYSKFQSRGLIVTNKEFYRLKFCDKHLGIKIKKYGVVK